MTTAQSRQPKGRPTGGQFAGNDRAAADVDLVAPFTFDGNYSNLEQVRPYLPAFTEVHAQLVATGQYPYNDSFRGRVPGIAGRSAEDTGIYLLQTMLRRDADHAKVDEFVASGGYEVTERDIIGSLRGTVVEAFFYVGGTGFRAWEGARLMSAPSRGGFVVIEKGKRNGTAIGHPGRVFIRETGAA